MASGIQVLAHIPMSNWEPKMKVERVHISAPDMVSGYQALCREVYILRKNGLKNLLPLRTGLTTYQVRDILPKRFRAVDELVLFAALHQEGYELRPLGDVMPKQWHKVNEAQTLTDKGENI